MYDKAKHDQTAALESIQLAGIMSRFGASLIDGILVGVVTGALVLILSQVGMSLGQGISFLLPIIYYWYFWTRRDGQTPGKSLCGIRVIKADGAAISDANALIRAIGYHISALFLGLGFIWAIFDSNNQTWHDKMAGTYVVTANSPRVSVNAIG